jgi:hypothetical protein
MSKKLIEAASAAARERVASALAEPAPEKANCMCCGRSISAARAARGGAGRFCSPPCLRAFDRGWPIFGTTIADYVTAPKDGDLAITAVPPTKPETSPPPPSAPRPPKLSQEEQKERRKALAAQRKAKAEQEATKRLDEMFARSVAMVTRKRKLRFAVSITGSQQAPASNETQWAPGVQRNLDGSCYEGLLEFQASSPAVP